MSRDSAELKISIESYANQLLQAIAERAHVYRHSIVCWRTLLDKKVEDDFKVNTDGTKSQPIDSPTSSLKSQY